MAIGKKQCPTCGVGCWTQARTCPAGHDFPIGRTARPTTTAARVVKVAEEPIVKPIAAKLPKTPAVRPGLVNDIAEHTGRKTAIPDKLFGGEPPPKGAQLVIAAAGTPPPIPLEDITNPEKLAAWVRQVRSDYHQMKPPQHPLLSALHTMILAQHSVRPETKTAYELLYAGMTEEQRDNA